jgi:predicted MFS family arabinose efflux permease
MTVPEPQFKPPAKLIWLLTVAAAVSVANLYYNQPLLPEIARSFHVSAGAAGVVATATQIGYALGMLLPNLAVLIAASLAIGVTNVVPQLIIPFAAGMTSPRLRGRVVGQVMSGLLIGILMGRVVAGVLANATGWRMVFGAASVTMLARLVTYDRKTSSFAELDIFSADDEATWFDMFKLGKLPAATI